MNRLLSKFQTNYKTVLFVLLFIQLYTFLLKHHLPQSLNALLFFGSSFLFGIAMILFFKDQKVEVINKLPKKNNKYIYLIGLIVIAFLSFAMYKNYLGFLGKPILVSDSDVIPTIQELCQRLENGEFVYKPIEKFGYHLPVTYLPMQWLPYMFAAKMGFDYRWIPIIIWIIAFAIVAIRSYKHNTIQNHILAIVLTILPYGFMALTPSNSVSNVLLNTVEIMVAGYYMLFIISLNISNPVIRGLIVGICLMSRYSLVLWLPVALVVLWINEPKRNLYISLLTAFLFVMVIYVIPFLSKDWMAFYNGYKYYDRSAVGEWEHLDPSNNLPYHLFGGYGFAFILYKYLPTWEVYDKVKLIQKLHFWGSISTTAILTLYYLKIKGKINYTIYLMASFKIYFAVFLFLIQVPYQYLMMVDVFVTIIIFIELNRFKIASAK